MLGSEHSRAPSALSKRHRRVAVSYRGALNCLLNLAASQSTCAHGRHFGQRFDRDRTVPVRAGAELIIYDTGGHLLVGQKEAVRKSIRSFLIAADSTSYDPQAKSN